MSIDPQRQRQLERTDRRIVRFRMVVGFAIVMILGLQLVSTQTILSNQTSARGTLSQLTHLTTAIHANQQSQLKGNATVKQILTEAGQVSAALEQGQAVTQEQVTTLLHDVQVLCRANPTCAAASP